LCTSLIVSYKSKDSLNVSKTVLVKQAVSSLHFLILKNIPGMYVQSTKY